MDRLYIFLLAGNGRSFPLKIRGKERARDLLPPKSEREICRKGCALPGRGVWRKKRPPFGPDDFRRRMDGNFDENPAAQPFCPVRPSFCIFPFGPDYSIMDVKIESTFPQGELFSAESELF
jgi:hypothetical protein